jgi:hypothetical protein
VITAPRLAIALAAVVVLCGACVAPGSEGAPRLDDPGRPQLTSLAPASTAPAASSSTTTTTTLGVPIGPEIPDGETVCDLYGGDIIELGVVASEAIVEASGLAASRVNDSTFWVVNDSGNESLLHAVGADGEDIAAIAVEGVLGFDWEDIAVGPGPEPGVSYIYIGDIGDNLRLRSTIGLLRFPEPDLTDPPAAISGVTTIRLSYPVEPEDSEAMWIDPITGEIFVATKRQQDGRAIVYRAPPSPVEPLEPIPLQRVAEFEFPDNGQVTGADVSTDGSVVALRGYNEVWMWVRTDLSYEATLAAEPCLAPAPEEIQGESLSFLPGELSYVTLSEGATKPLNLVPVSRP